MKVKRLFMVLLMVVALMSTGLIAYAESDTWTCPNCGQTATGNFCNNCGTSNPNQVVAADVSSTPEEGIHRYEYCVEDCSWSQAFQQAKDKGGYLVHIDSREEFNYLTNEISQKGLNNIRFMLGGRRPTESTSYFWVDGSNNTYGAAINSPEYWAYSAWMQGEPSLADGDILETCMCMFYSSDYGSWVLNDVPEDILAVVPDFSGTIGYIVEYEDGGNTGNVQTNPDKLPYESVIAEYKNAVSIYGTTPDTEIVRGQCPNVNPHLVDYYYRWPGSMQFLYTYYDIDGNGKDELLLGYGDPAGDPEGLYNKYFDVFSTDGTSTYRFFDEDSMGDRTRLTIYTDGTMDVNGSSGAASGRIECWVIGADGFTPTEVAGFSYDANEIGEKYYNDFVGNINPEDYENSLLSKTEITVTAWTKII